MPNSTILIAEDEEAARVSLQGLLESEGFEVRFATLFDRPTELEDPVRGLEQWLLMFQQKALAAIPAESRTAAFRQIENQLRPELFYDGKWHIDYRRIRVVSVAL